MQLTEGLAVHLPRHLWEPVVKGPEKSEEDAADDYVVKMRDHEIGTAQVPIERRRAVHDACETSDQELEKKSNADKHRRLYLNLAAPQGCKSVEDLNAGWNGDGHGGDHEKCI